ncbi:MAG TPA: Ig-like domain-containing protein [Thermoanaerobaculia bacterium]
MVRSPTTTTLTIAPPTTPPYDEATLEAHVTGANPTGTVTFLDNGLPISTCGAVTLSGGSAACTAIFGPSGLSLSASYSGDVNNAPSVSAAAVLTLATVPALDPRGLAVLAALLGLVAMVMLRK